MKQEQRQQQLTVMSMELYQSLISDMPIGIMVCNTRGEFILWNDEATKMFKSELRSSTKDKWAEDFGVFELDKTTQYKTEDIPMAKALRGEFVENEKLYIKNNGDKEGIYIKVTSYPLLDLDAKIIAGVVLFEDVTQEQKWYEGIISKLSELEEFIRGSITVNNLKLSL